MHEVIFAVMPYQWLVLISTQYHYHHYLHHLTPIILFNSIGGGALPCVFSYILNNSPEKSRYSLVADTDAVVVKNHWDNHLRHTLDEYCVAGINPRPSLNAVEWNWVGFKTDVYRNKKKGYKYSHESVIKDVEQNITGFADWGQWWEMRAAVGGW